MGDSIGNCPIFIKKIGDGPINVALSREKRKK
jgi:hypothetical protein